MTEAFITPTNLAWARSRAGISIAELAEKVQCAPEKIVAWEIGEKRPSLRQAEELATKLHIPLGYLFLSSPPPESPALPDFRVGYADQRTGMSLDLSEVVDSATRRQEACREIIENDGTEPLSFVSSFGAEVDPTYLATDMRHILKIDDGFARRSLNWSDHLSRLVHATENSGILVFRSSIVGSNSHRRLSVEEFRGFALCDVFAPLVFINAADYKAAQIFTLAHELAHIWIGKSGVSNQKVDGFLESPNNEIEILCDRAAAEFLVPRDLFISDWKSDNEHIVEIQRLARLYRTSAIVILRRAFDLHLIRRTELFELLERVKGFIFENKNQKENRGGDFFATFNSRNGERFPSIVLGALRGGKLLYREAARLLDVHPNTLTSLEIRYTW